MNTNSVVMSPWRKALATATTSTSFTAKTPTTTKPVASTTRSVIDLYDGSLGISITGYTPKYVSLAPYLTAANNVTGDLRLWGWSKTADISTNVWVPTLLLQLAVVAGNLDGGAIETSAFMADTLTVTYGGDEATEISPANDLGASVLTHIRGAELLEFDFDVGTATAANCLWRVMDER
jgi:hypothetical protein